MKMRQVPGAGEGKCSTLGRLSSRSFEFPRQSGQRAILHSSSSHLGEYTLAQCATIG
jgi:hypothetical protein